MKTVYISILFASLSTCGVLATGFSETNDGFYIAISGSSTNEPVASNDPLSWRPFCTRSTAATEFNYPDPARGIKIKMLDFRGKQIRRTELGKSYGTKFDKLSRFQDIIPAPHAGYSSGHVGSILAKGSYNDTDAVSGPLLPSAQDLFQIQKPGIYTLEIQMQMFLIHKTANQWTRKLIRFSPVKIKVVMP